MLQSGRTTRDLLRTSKFSVQVVPGQAIKKVKVEHCVVSVCIGRLPVNINNDDSITTGDQKGRKEIFPLH